MADNPNMVQGGQLLSFVERVERLNEDRTEISDQVKLVYAEAKSQGYTPRYIRAVVRLRQKPPSEREEDEAMMDMYMAAIGMARETPLFRHVAGMGADAMVKERVIEALKLLAPVDGEITVKVAGTPRMRIWRDKEGVRAEEVPDIQPLPASGAKKRQPGEAPPKREVPTCTEAEAFAMGKQAWRDDEPVITNPFPWDDKRRRAWDEGWRDEDGGDGMGPR